jgi:hypothetical protein
MNCTIEAILHPRNIAFVFALVVASGCAVAEDVTPRVLPDRMEDVPATRPDPFPAFDSFAWRAFVAFNWPALTDAAHRGEPDRAKSLGDAGQRVWETFKSRFEVFRRGLDEQALAPAPWATYAGRTPCGGLVDKQTKTLASLEPFADFNQASFIPGKFLGPLVSQNRTYTRYEVRFNEAEFNSIVDHGWYRRDALPTAEEPGRFNVGSTAVKAAWRILTDVDTPATRRRYYVVPNAQVVDVATTLAKGRIACVRRDIALVGLHIVVKTQYRPQGIWSSFEHIDNVPPVGSGDAREPDARDSNAPYSYNDPAKSQSDIAPLNSALAQSVGRQNPPGIRPEPTQVIRKHPINPETMAINRAYWALPEIRGTVWANYMLVATQWPTVTQPPTPDNDGRYFPGLRIDPSTPAEPYQAEGASGDQNLANTTMETYSQDSPASCMACHHAVSNAFGRDFVGILTDAN